MAKKGDKKKSTKSPVNDVVTREYTINLHKRIHGMWVLINGFNLFACYSYKCTVKCHRSGKNLVEQFNNPFCKKDFYVGNILPKTWTKCGPNWKYIQSNYYNNRPIIWIKLIVLIILCSALQINIIPLPVIMNRKIKKSLVKLNFRRSK